MNLFEFDIICFKIACPAPWKFKTTETFLHLSLLGLISKQNWQDIMMGEIIDLLKIGVLWRIYHTYKMTSRYQLAVIFQSTYLQGATFKIKAPIETSFSLIVCLWGHQNYSNRHCPNPVGYIQAQSLLPQLNLASVEVIM